MKKLSTVFLSLFLCTRLVAAPSITSISGTITDGSTLTITCTGAGTKNPAKPVIWAPFDSDVNPSSLGINTSWDGSQNFSWDSASGLGGGGGAKGTGGQPSPSKWTFTVILGGNGINKAGTKTYVFMDQKQNFQIGTGDANNNYKIRRRWPSGGSGYPNWYVAANNGQDGVEDQPDAWGFYNTFNAWPKSGGSTSIWPSGAYVSDTFESLEFVSQAASALDAGDGSEKFYVNGTLLGSGPNGAKILKTNPSARPATMTDDYLVHFVNANQGSWTGGWSSSYRPAVDNVYYDTGTWARVMVGNASTLSSCTKLEPQIPSAWSDTSITVAAVLPSSKFAAGTTNYAYVIDSGNNASTGYTVVVGNSGGGGGGGGGTPSVPTPDTDWRAIRDCLCR